LTARNDSRFIWRTVRPPLRYGSFVMPGVRAINLPKQTSCRQLIAARKRKAAKDETVKPET
jgi:hypothetical protein